MARPVHASRVLAGDGRGAASIRRSLDPVPLAFVAVGVAILVALGVWQVQRLAWKEALLARIAALQTAPPEPLGVVLHRLGDRGEVDFVRVQVDCPTLQQTPTLKLYAILNGVMGERVITACPIVMGPYRSILVDRGFVAGQGAVPVAPGPSLAEPVVGVLRKTERRSWAAPANDPSEPEWRSRDLPAMAKALRAPHPAPLFLMLERPGARPGPVPAAVPTDIPNNHLGYALTWFGLAAGLAGVYVASRLRSQPR